MAATDASPPASDESKHVPLTGTLTEFLIALEEEIDAAQCARRPATGDGAPDAR